MNETNDELTALERDIYRRLQQNWLILDAIVRKKARTVTSIIELAIAGFDFSLCTSVFVHQDTSEKLHCIYNYAYYALPGEDVQIIEIGGRRSGFHSAINF